MCFAKISSLVMLYRPQLRKVYVFDSKRSLRFATFGNIRFKFQGFPCSTSVWCALLCRAEVNVKDLAISFAFSLFPFTTLTGVAWRDSHSMLNMWLKSARQKKTDDTIAMSLLLPASTDWGSIHSRARIPTMKRYMAMRSIRDGSSHMYTPSLRECSSASSDGTWWAAVSLLWESSCTVATTAVFGECPSSVGCAAWSVISCLIVPSIL